MSIETVAPSATHRKKRRRARTNRGMYGSLERRYWQGDLAEAEEQGFEALIYVLRTLYRETIEAEDQLRSGAASARVVGRGLPITED